MIRTRSELGTPPLDRFWATDELLANLNRHEFEVTDSQGVLKLGNTVWYLGHYERDKCVRFAYKIGDLS